MSEYLIVLAMPCCRPVASSEALSPRAHAPPEWVIGLTHAAAGVAIAVVGVDLMPRILDGSPSARHSGLPLRRCLLGSVGEGREAPARSSTRAAARAHGWSIWQSQRISSATG